MMQPTAADPAIANLQGRSFRQMTTNVRTSGSASEAEPVTSSTAGSLPVLFSLPSLTDSDSLTSGTLAIGGQSDPPVATSAFGAVHTAADPVAEASDNAVPMSAAAPVLTTAAAVQAVAERQPISAAPSPSGLPDWLSHWSGGLGLVVSLLVLMVVGIVFVRGARLDSSGSTARLVEELSDHLTDAPQVQFPDSELPHTAVAARSLADQQSSPSASGRLISQLRDRYGSESETNGSAGQSLAPEPLTGIGREEFPEWPFDLSAPSAPSSPGVGTRYDRATGEPVDDSRTESFQLESLNPVTGREMPMPLGDQGYVPPEWGPVAQLGQPISQAPAVGIATAGRLDGVEADAAVVSRGAPEAPRSRSAEPTAGRIYTETEYAHLSVQELLALRQQAQQQLARGFSGPGAAARHPVGDSLSSPMASPDYHSAARPAGEAGNASGQPTSQGLGDQQPLTHPSLTR